MAVDSGVKVGTAIVWAIALFVLSAVIEAIIQVWVFKHWGGCPMQKKER